MPKLSNAVPKPRRKRTTTKRAFSSIKPKTYKQKLAAAKKLHSHHPIRAKNPVQAAKKNVRYRAGMAAYKKSETYKAVEQRAAGQCEVQTNLDTGKLALCAVRVEGYIRCPNTRAEGIRLEHHHLGYFRFGGDELPEDMLVCCTPHHRLIEAAKGKRR